MPLTFTIELFTNEDSTPTSIDTKDVADALADAQLKHTYHIMVKGPFGMGRSNVRTTSIDMDPNGS